MLVYTHEKTLVLVSSELANFQSVHSSNKRRASCPLKSRTESYLNILLRYLTTV